jgi:anti-anti-sigma factor
VTPLQVSIRESGDVAILDLRGRWTADVAEKGLLKTHLQKLIADGVRRFLLNLADLTQIDSSGVSSIVKAHRFLSSLGRDLKILRPSGHALEVFRVLQSARDSP